jgi:hypothetical protein
LVSVGTFVDSVDTENGFHTKSVFMNPHLRRNMCQFHSNALISTSVSVAVGTCVNFVVTCCLAVDY